MKKSSNSSSVLMCCRGCLATNVNLFDIHKNQLAEAFGSITGYPVLPRDGFPQKLCGLCGVLLAKCAAFRERCRRAQHCLQDRDKSQRTMDYIATIDRLSHNLVFKLAVTQLELTGIPPLEVKNEPAIVVKETIFKEENIDFSLDTAEELNFSPLDDIEETLDDSHEDRSDEVNDVGKNIEIEKVLIPTEKVEVKKGRRSRKKNAELRNKTNTLKKLRITGPSPTNEYQPNFDVAELEKELNVDIEILNMEQQLADWRQFSASKKAPAAFTCQECGKGFDFRDTYDNHLLRHSPSVGAFGCEVCGARFPRRSERRSHRQRHALRFTCRACQFVTRNKNQAKLHFSSHTGRTFQCKHCEKTFIKRSTYLSHVRLAHAAQNVPCGECGETFVSRFGLTQHQTKVHKAQKAASKCACKSCGAVFNNAEALSTHARMLAAAGGCDPAARPCAACGAPLPTEEALQRHIEECHKEEFKCTECPLTFASDASLDTHYWRVHRALRWRRAAAKQQRRREARQGSPARWRSRVCAQCGKECRTSFSLEEHMRIHSGEKPHECSDCSLRFSNVANLKRHHKVVHLGQRPMVKCPECGKRLGSASLTTHIKYVHRKLPQKPRVRKPKDK